MTKFKTYLVWTNSPRPSNGGEEIHVSAHATRLEHWKHQLDRYLNIYQLPLATQLGQAL